jgi:DNA-binding NtrC family response regulator
MARVLIVEDQEPVAKALCVLLEVHDLPCTTASSPQDALGLIAAEDFGLVIQDMNFSAADTSGREGIELFRSIHRHDPALPVLLLTAWTSLETAVQMVKEGAADYLAKPWDDTKLLAAVRNLLRLRELQLENDRLKAETSRARQDLLSRYDLCGIVYESAAMHRVVSLAVQVAAADVPVLITGPNGAGKEKLAEIIQVNSRRRTAPFVRVNAGALPDELLESELFGAEPGAFTGAVRRRLGRFEMANEGTLFLDEIGNLSPAGQAKLLRVLQRGEFERLGSSETQRVDVRVIAATNVDVADARAQGRFREDLFFRLSVIELRVPPLCERPEDVLPLARTFLRGSALADGGPERTLSERAVAALLAHDWPGNVRELMNRIQRAALVAPAGMLEPSDLGLEPEPAPAAPAAGEPLPTEADAEKRRVEEVLRQAEGSVSVAAARLGLSRQALYRRMEKLGIVLERRPKG